MAMTLGQRFIRLISRACEEQRMETRKERARMEAHAEELSRSAAHCTAIFQGAAIRKALAEEARRKKVVNS